MEVGGQAAFEGGRKCRSFAQPRRVRDGPDSPARQCRRCHPVGAERFSAFADPQKKALQPHGVATSLHNLSDETLQPAPSPIQGIAPRYDVLAPDFRRRAGAYRLQGDVNAAIADFDRPIRVEPKKIDSLLRRGLAYLEMGNSDLAIRDFTEVLNLSPRHAVAIRSRPQSYFAAGDLKRAVSDYALLIQLNPRNARAFDLRGLAERELQELDRALDDFTRMIQIERACALRHASI